MKWGLWILFTYEKVGLNLAVKGADSPRSVCWFAQELLLPLVPNTHITLLEYFCWDLIQVCTRGLSLVSPPLLRSLFLHAVGCEIFLKCRLDNLSKPLLVVCVPFYAPTPAWVASPISHSPTHALRWSSVGFLE